MIAELLTAVQWCGECASASNTVMFIDDGFAEYVRWSGEKLPSLPAVSLHLDSHVLAMLCMRQPRYILILVSSHEPNLIHNLKVISAHSDCTKIVVASMARPPSEEEQQAYAAFVGTELQPVTVDIYHVQASAIKLLEADETGVGLFVLSSPSCRAVPPLSLRRMGLLGADISVKSVNDILAEDIPLPVRQELKLLTMEVASALVHSFGVDPTGHIFSVGKTSSILGHSLHPIIAQMLTERRESKDTTKSSLREGSLVLIDRSMDLYTPASSSSAIGGTVFARVIATISRQRGELNIPQYADGVADDGRNISSCGNAFPMLDIDLQCATVYPNIRTCVDNDTSDESLFTMSGLSSLPVQVIPTICKPNCQIQKILAGDAISAEMESIWRSFVTMSEEQTRAVLCDALKRFIKAENGTLPPSKKRGFGAELLALVNSLILSPGVGELEAKTGLKFNARLYLKYISVISLTASIIDSLQRSPSKQFRAAFPELGTWKSSFEDRCAFESRWIDDCCRRIAAGCPVGEATAPISFTHAMKQEQALDDIILNELNLRILHPLDAFKSTGKTADVTDLIYFLTFVVSVSCIWSRQPSSTCIQRVSAVISDYLITMSPLQELYQITWLSREIINDILRCRGGESIKEDSSMLTQQLSLELIDTVGSLLFRIEEFVDLAPKSLLESFASINGAHNRSGLLHQIFSLLIPRGQTSADLTRRELLKSLGVNHVADPLKKLARAGLGLLSYGLNSFGLSSAPVTVMEPEPFDRGVIVLFVVGGISPVEIGQVQREIDLLNNNASVAGGSIPRIILGSNNILCPDDIYKQIYG